MNCLSNRILAERQVFLLNISTQQLRYFMEVAKCLNFTRAAANLYVAQPTLSQQIADLEAQLDISLFVRSSRSVSLTPAGKILYDACPDLVARTKQLHQHMLTTAAGFSGSLTIGFLNVFIDFIPQIIREFKNAFPDVAIQPVCANLHDLTCGLKNHTIDVAFTLCQDFAIEDLTFCSIRPIFEDNLCFVLPGEYPTLSDYSFTESLPLISYDKEADPCYYPCASATLKMLGLQASEVIYTNSLGNIRAYLESGTGFTMLPTKNSGSFSEGTQFIPIPNAKLEYGALWDPDSQNPALPLFLDALEQFLEPDSDGEQNK